MTPDDSVTLSFDAPGDFVACRAAENWLRERGYSVGWMQGPSPRGILRGDWLIAKWRNLSAKERKELDGTMSGDMRNGPVSIRLKSAPVDREDCPVKFLEDA